MRVRSRFAPVLLALLAARAPAGGLARERRSAAQPRSSSSGWPSSTPCSGRARRPRSIDVRSRQEYLTRHIKGAISIPLDTIELRAGEVSRQGLVVLY